MSGGANGKRVSFLIAGVQKAGTTALFDYLSEVPGLELPAVKEAHFFDDEERIDWAAPDYAPYHALFGAPDRCWGEATPIYLYWPNALERIRAYNPAMKLILLFRDPVMMLTDACMPGVIRTPFPIRAIWAGSTFTCTR